MVNYNLLYKIQAEKKKNKQNDEKMLRTKMKRLNNMLSDMLEEEPEETSDPISYTSAPKSTNNGFKQKTIGMQFDVNSVQSMREMSNVTSITKSMHNKDAQRPYDSL